MKRVRFVVAFVVAATLFGCGGTSTPPESDPSMQENRLVGTGWELTSGRSATRERLLVQQLGDYRIFWVEENRGVVQVVNNQCVVHYNSTGRSLTLRLDCPPGRVAPGSVGREFLNILDGATRFRMTSNQQEMTIETLAGGQLNFRRMSDEQIRQLGQQRAN